MTHVILWEWRYRNQQSTSCSGVYRRHKATPVMLPWTNLASVPKRKVRAVGGEDMLNGFKFVSGIGGFTIIPWLGGRHPQVINIDTHIHIFIRYTTKRPEKNEKNGGKNSTTLMVWSQKKTKQEIHWCPKKVHLTLPYRRQTPVVCEDVQQPQICVQRLGELEKVPTEPWRINKNTLRITNDYALKNNDRWIDRWMDGWIDR